MYRPTRKDLYGLSAFGLGFVILLVLVVFRFSGTQRDPVTLCYPGEPISAHFMFILDQSDPVPTRSIDLLKLNLNATLDAMSVGDKISIFYMNDSTSAFSDTNISLCNPGGGKDANPWIENPRKREKLYDERFLKPLAPDGFDSSAKQSPIIEYLEDLCKLARFREAASQRTLVILSDMIQNSPLLNQYRTSLGFKEFNSTHPVNACDSIRGVTVRVLLIPRAQFGAIQSAAFREFWTELLIAYGARSVEFF